MNDKPVSESLLDHYDRYLGKWDTGLVVDDRDGRALHQILIYDHVIQDCWLFLTCGVSNYLRTATLMVEMIAVTDDGWDDIPDLLTAAAVKMSSEDSVPAPHHWIDDVDTWVPGFRERFGKSGLYFSVPYHFDADFPIVELGHSSRSHPHHAGILMASFVSPAEIAFLDEHGGKAFERLLEVEGVDPTNLARESVV